MRSAGELAGVRIEYEELGDQWQQAVVRHEYPYRDGADLEPLGFGARVCQIRCHFLGDRYEEHKGLVDTLRGRRDLVDFFHPAYGLLKGAVEWIQVRHDDLDRTATVDLSFVEGSNDVGAYEFPQTGVAVQTPRSAADVASGVSVQDTLEDLYVDAATESETSLSAAVQTALAPSDATGLLEAAFDPELPLVDQLGTASRTARAYALRVDTFVAALGARVSAYTNPANSLLALVDFGLNVPGRIGSTVARCAERYALAVQSVSSSPARLLRKLQEAGDEIAGAHEEFAGAVRTAFAARAGLEAAALYHADEARRSLLRRAEKRAPFDALGRRVEGAPPEPVLTVTELEQSLATARHMLQQALDADRSALAPRRMAEALLDHVSRVKLEAEKLVEITVDEPTPLHLLCLSRGLPAGYAERLAAVNRFPHPSKVQGKVLVYAR